jgi:dihydrofolate reductase
MALVRLYMTMSLDGYVAGPQDGPDAPMGIDGFRLFNWLDRREDPGPSGQVYAEALATRAVIAGRRTYELAGRWQGDHHDGVPVFVLTHDVPGDPPPGSVRYVTDVRECAAQARAAAGDGDGDVMVHGAGAAQALLRAGELDELELHVVPVLLGQGRRLFDHMPAQHVELDLVRRLTTPQSEDLEKQVMHLRYRVLARLP